MNLKVLISKYLDTFTGPLILEIAAESKYDELTLQYMIALGYVCALVILTWMAGRICRIFPPIMNGLIWWFGNGILSGLLLGFWVISRLWIIAATKEATPKGLVTPWKDILAEKRGHLVWGWLDPVLLNILFVLAMSYFTQLYAVSQAGIVSVATLILLAKTVPGVGGNSTMGIIALGIALIIAVIVSPPVFAILLEFLKDKAKTSPVTHTIGVLGSTRTILDGATTSDTVMNAIQLDPYNYLDVIRVMIGSIVLFWMIMDDWRGPGELLKMFTQMHSKKDMILNSAASIDTGILWVVALSQIVWDIISHNTLGLALRIISFVIAYVLWNRYGGPIWAGRAQAAGVINGRPGCEISVGDGPRGRRRLVVGVALAVGIVCFMWSHFTNVGLGISMLLMMCLGTEKFTGIALGIVTFNAGILGVSLMSKRPFSGSLDSSMRDAYVPGVGANNG